MAIEWDIDVESGHLAHPSGLYGYLTELRTTTGGIVCTGPHSSYSSRTSKDKVLHLSADASQVLEELHGTESYSLWGTYTKLSGCSGPIISILDQEYRFIANPSFRTTALLSVPPSKNVNEMLRREWDPIAGDLIEHKMGISFAFSPGEKEKTVHCSVNKMVDFDGYAVCREVLQSTIASLASAAACVILRIGRLTFGLTPKSKLIVSIDSSLDYDLTHQAMD